MKPPSMFTVFLLAVAFTAGFQACQKPLELSDTQAPYDRIAVTVNELELDSVVLSGRLFLHQPALRVNIRDLSGRDPSSGSAVIFNVYKYYPATGVWNLSARIFGGGAGYSSGDTAFYVDDRGVVDTLLYRTLLDTLIIIGSENKNEFQIGVSAITNLSYDGARFFKGLENPRILDPVIRSGGYTRTFSINNNASHTISNIVTVSARFPVYSGDTLVWVRYSMLNTVTFDQVLKMEAALRNALPSDSSFVTPFSGYRLRLADSMLLTTQQAPVGKFGGLFRIPMDSLSGFFDEVVRLDKRGMDSGWVRVSKQDTLPLWAGQKWLYAYHNSWGVPITANIGIKQWVLEVLLDETAARTRYNPYNSQVCLLDDHISYIVNTYGDTSFESDLFIWIATRNLYPEFLRKTQTNASFPAPFLMQNQSELSGEFKWVDAVLETPPERAGLNSEGYVKGVLHPDYEQNYRVSPLGHQYLSLIDNKDAKFVPPHTYKSDTMPVVFGPAAIGEYLDLIENGLRFVNDDKLSLIIKKGSVLGYDERSLNLFAAQDSTLGYFEGKFTKSPMPGWFVYEPLSSFSPDSTFDPYLIINRFRQEYDVDMTTLLPDPSKGISGRKYFSLYSAFMFRPDNQFRRQNLYHPRNGGLKVYRNPFRSLPYFSASNMAGAKEFIICAYGKGKYFKEPRASISLFSGTRRYVWDKTPPHFLWHDNYNSKAPAYAPMYYLNNQNGLITQTDLSAVNYVFDVFLSGRASSENKDCSVRDVGFGRITSVKLCFNYSTDLKSVNPVTGLRSYSKNSIKFDLDARIFAGQRYGVYIDNSLRNIGYSIENASFKGIDAGLWQSGLWDMWMETSDDLGNEGIAPLVTSTTSYDASYGKSSVRQIMVR